MIKQRKISHILVTGGAGFIGSAFVRYLCQKAEFSGHIIVLDSLSYAADLDHLKEVEGYSNYRFFQEDICNKAFVEGICKKYQIDTIVHFAAETHVDRSISDPHPFIQNNIVGTFSLLEVLRKLPHIHFHHISTDEVYGTLGETGAFSETSPFAPNSPYAATKAAADHLVRAYGVTYGLSCTISHCSNNYGPCQNEEKLIPLILRRSLCEEPLPIYGQGINIRDWIYVEDHIEALWLILQYGRKGQTYDIGGGNELRNIDLVFLLLDILAKKQNRPQSYYQRLLTFVEDRAGHDYRYAIDSTKIRKELGWKPRHSIEEGLEKTIDWHLAKYKVGENILN